MPSSFWSGRFGSWALLLGKFTSVQLIVQILGFASGLLLVRTLSKNDYALFTIANTMMGTMSLLADCGIGSGLTSIGGRIWSDPVRFGRLIRTALKLRKAFALIAVAAVGPILAWLLIKNGASVPATSAILAAVLASLCFQLTIGVLTVIPRLLLQTGRLQQIDLLAAGCRLAFLLIASVILLDASIALFTATAAFAIQWSLLRSWARNSIAWSEPPDEQMRGEILQIVRRQAPNSIYFCVQGQLAVWLISVFGNAQRVADIGALGRLAVIFTVLGSVMSSVIIPRFARCQEPNLLWKRYWQIIAFYLAFGGAITLAGAVFPTEILWILGGKYENLHRELLLIILSNGLFGILGAAYSLNSSRGWILPTWLNIGSSLAAQLLAIAFLDLSSVIGVLLLGMVPIIPELLLTVGMAVRRMNSLQLSNTNRN